MGLTLACVVVELYALVVIVRILLSWFANPATGVLAAVNRGLWAATEPLLTPIRTVVRPFQVGGAEVDAAPALLLVALALLAALLCR